MGLVLLLESLPAQESLHQFLIMCRELFQLFSQVKRSLDMHVKLSMGPGAHELLLENLSFETSNET